MERVRAPPFGSGSRATRSGTGSPGTTFTLQRNARGQSSRRGSHGFGHRWPRLFPTAWERRLVALLRTTLHPLDARDSPAEFARDRDVLVQKVESFAGRIEEAGRSGLVAAFGLEPAEDAPRRAALAAMAIQNALARTRQTQARRASIAIAIHADHCLVGQVDGRTQLSADAKHHLETVLGDLSLRTPPDSILVSKTARPFLDRRFDFEDAEARYEWSGRGVPTARLPSGPLRSRRVPRTVCRP